MGWGTRSAGILLGCLLAPLAQAQVDLEPFLKQDVLETLRSPEFRARCAELPGYDATAAGELVAVRTVLGAA